MDKVPELCVLRLRRTQGPTRARAFPLLLLTVEPTESARSRSVADWTDLLQLFRERCAPWEGRLPPHFRELVQQSVLRGGSEALCALLSAAFAVLVQRLGVIASDSFSLQPEKPDGSRLLAIGKPPCRVDEDALGLLGLLVDHLAALQKAPSEEERAAIDTALTKLWQACDSLALHPFAGFLIGAAHARDLPVERMPVEDRRFLRVGEGNRQKRFVGAVPHGQRSISVTLGQRRDTVIRRLRDGGIPLARFGVLKSGSDVDAIVQHLGEGPYLRRPFTRRPQEAAPRLFTGDELRQSSDAASEPEKAFLVQALPAGTRLRLFVYGGSCLAACELPPLNDPSGLPRTFDDALAPEIHTLASDVARLLDLDFLSIDLVATGPESGPVPPEVVVIDVDPLPEPAAHLTPTACARLARAFLDTAFPAGNDGRIPRATIFAAAPGEPALRLCGALRQAGRTAGLLKDGEAILSGRRLNGSVLPPTRLLDDRQADCALAAVTPAEVRQSGLPFERSSVSLIGIPPTEAVELEYARLLAATTEQTLILPFGANPAALDPPPHLKLVAYGVGDETPVWANAVVRWCQREDGGAIFFDERPQRRSNVRVLQLPAEMGGAEVAALAALLLALDVPLRSLGAVIAQSLTGRVA